ncbi:predicted protein [Histoplasma capsulatum G186AR]|uniref:F-box domain-containing protein n=1 Tax=Ajellomyces capsulatus (strain G186AR / H82 / ATCC MYA-2454 / RMSCC 2432) TaxID=447093 RepID=C0NX49_AJECG|nr:uncharacterized protein HCBG_08041 [Histoplasma capsulatum G186AR]EEH03915.1 predicted protein [Histoplasma capsulatum G186AR]
MSLISKLPTELVEEIARHMDKCVLKNFGSVCWRFRSIVEPRLYETIGLNNPETSYREVLKLLIAIDKRPQMVSRTEVVTISEPDEGAHERELVQAAKLDPKVTVNEVIPHLLSKLPILHSFRIRSHQYSACIRCEFGIPFDFSNLRKIVNIQLPWYSLSSTPGLPPTLAHLDLDGAGWVDGDYMENLLVNCVKQKHVEGPDAGGLKIITIDVILWRRKELETICKNKGIQLELSWGPLQSTYDVVYGRGDVEPWDGNVDNF